MIVLAATFFVGICIFYILAWGVAGIAFAYDMDAQARMERNAKIDAERQAKKASKAERAAKIDDGFICTHEMRIRCPEYGHKCNVCTRVMMPY